MTKVTPSRRVRLILAIGLPLLALAVVASVVGPRIYAASVNDDAAPPPSLSVPSSAPSSTSPAESELPSSPSSPSAGTNSSAADLVGAWQIGAGSFAGYRVDEVLNGANVTVTGRTAQVTGSMTVAGSELTAATIVVDMASVTTDSDRRDNYFRQTALKTSQFPQATFALTQPVSLANLTAGAPLTVTVSGTLTIAGVSNPVSVELQVARSGDAVEVIGAVPITFADYDVIAPDLGFVKVEPQGSVEFSLKLGR